MDFTVKAAKKAALQAKLEKLKQARRGLTKQKSQIDKTDTSIYRLQNKQKENFKGKRRTKTNNKLKKLHSEVKSMMSLIDDDIFAINNKIMEIEMEIGSLGDE